MEYGFSIAMAFSSYIFKPLKLLCLSVTGFPLNIVCIVSNFLFSHHNLR